jgi:uncharacterized membrane protein HdeD (DUF308 family)
MTDPRSNPADSPGSQGGTNPPGSGGGGRRSGRGLFHRGSDSGQKQAGNVGTATRTTQTTSVPQQTGQRSTQPAATPARTEYGDATYGEARYGTSEYGGTGPDQNMLAKAAKLSWAVVALGAACMIALGILLLVWPHATLTLVAILIGCGLVVSGAVRLWEGFTAKGGESGGMRAAYIVIGLFAVVAGLYCLRHHALSLFLVAFVAGVYFVMHGVAEIGAAASSPGSGRGLRTILGIFSIAAGLILVIWPQISLVLLLTIMGAWLLFYGVVLGGLALSLRKSAKSMESSAAPTTAARARAA